MEELLLLRGSCLLASSPALARGMSMLLRLRWRLPSRVGDADPCPLLTMMPGERRSWSCGGDTWKYEIQINYIIIFNICNHYIKCLFLPVHWWHCPCDCCSGFHLLSDCCCTEHQTPRFPPHSHLWGIPRKVKDQKSYFWQLYGQVVPKILHLCQHISIIRHWMLTKYWHL